jgi:AAA domain
VETRRVASWTAAGLLGEVFTEPRWAVPGLIPEGVTLLAGPPKAGKSWLALDLCVAVAAGGRALGSIDVQAGPVLYLALEDTPRRLQSRLRQVLAGAEPPAGFVLAIECPPMPQGLVLIEKWLEREAEPRLVVIDIFERIRGQDPPGTKAYTADYSAIRQVKTLADAYGVGILLVHHLRKMGSADYMSEISGTNGLSGAADTIAILKRQRGEIDGILHITGRDVEEQEYALKFAPELGAWQLVGLAAESGLADTRRKILSYVRTHPGERPSAIAMAIGLDHDLVKQTVIRMAKDSQLDTDGQGRYFHPAPAPPV